MANTITLAEKFLPVVDAIYKSQSITACLDTNSSMDFTGANEVKILKVSTTGLGDYSRTDGYPKGDITATWETLKLSQERGKELNIDRMDNEETLGMVFGTVTGNFLNEQVVPELDAYRFAKYASTEGILTADAGELTSENILAAIDDAVKAMDDAEVPAEGRKLFISSDLKPALNGALSRQWGSDEVVNNVLSGYNNMPVIYVPKSRFYTDVQLNDGTSSWGFNPTEDAKNINFMIVYPNAVVQAKKFAMPKIFSPDENQDKDMWKFQFRMYHDAFVMDNKKCGIYLHKSN